MSSVGGFAFFLYSLGNIFVKISLQYIGRNSDQILLQAIYKRDPDFDGDKKSSRRSLGTKRSPLRYIERRKGFILQKVFCGCLRNQREKRLISKGIKRADHELEISHFIKY